MFRDEAGEPFTIFNDPNFTDKEYHKQFPTIHHLICELMNKSSPHHDVRLVYLACAWLVVHRGHFLSDISEDNNVINIEEPYKKLTSLLSDLEQSVPWSVSSPEKVIEDVMLSANGKKDSLEGLKKTLFPGTKLPKGTEDPCFPYDTETFLKLLCKSSVK